MIQFLNTLGALLLFCAFLGSLVLLAIHDNLVGAISCGVILSLLAWAAFRQRNKLLTRVGIAAQVGRQLQILEDCLRLCRESRNPAVRVTRANTAMEKIAIVEELAPGTISNRHALTEYFHAVALVTEVESAWRKAREAGTERTRAKHMAAVRQLLSAKTITDRDLEAAEANDPIDGNRLTLSRLLEEASAVDEDEVPAESLVSPGVATPPPLPQSDGLPARPPSLAPPRWIPAGESVSVGGLIIPGGMIYFGDHEQATHAEPSMIDPALPVQFRNPDGACSAVEIGPWYVYLTPAARGVYLTWLAGNRMDATADIRCAFLFLAGIERRILSDGKRRDLPKLEVEAIRAELVRLLDSFGTRGTIGNYVTGLLSVVDVAFRHVYSLPALGLAGGGVPAPSLRAGLGRFSMRDEPLPPEWALGWVCAASDIRIASVMERVPEEFNELFAMRYRVATNGGLFVKPNATQVSWQYTPASRAQLSRYQTITLDVPDVFRLTAPLRTLEVIAEECKEALAPFARLIGRSPDARGSLPAWAALPSDLAAGCIPPPVSALRTLLVTQMEAGDSCVMETSALVAQWPENSDGRLSKSESVQFAVVLERLGLGIEPDVRFDGATLGASPKAVVYRLTDGAAGTPSPAFGAATLILRLAATVAAADGTVSEAERRALLDHVGKNLELDKAQSSRLAAHWQWLEATQPDLSGLKRRLEPLDMPQRTSLAGLLLGLVMADGRASPQELKLLARVYKLLGLDPDRVHSDLHQFMVAGKDMGDDPVVVASADSAPSGYRIPGPPATQSSAVVLDSNAIERKLRETTAVSALLRGIFDDETAQVSPAGDGHPVASDLSPRIGGLDVRHSKLLQLIASKPSVARAEFEVVASELGLMPDGALEVLNEAAFTVCDAPLCEDDDPLVLDQSVMERLMR